MKKSIINPCELSHHFHACGIYYHPGTNIRCGGVQGYAESENELYALIESEDWEHDPKVGEIICTEILDGKVIRRWNLSK